MATRRPWLVIACALVFGVIAAAFGSSAPNVLSNARGDFFDPRSESLVGAARLADAEGANPEADVVALVRTGEDVVRASDARAEVRAAARRLAEDPAAAKVVTVYDAGGSPTMVSEDDESTVVLVYLEPGADRNDAARSMLDRFSARDGVQIGGQAIVAYEAIETVERDLVRAELLAFPLLAVLLIWVFRSLVAALLPLLVGALAVAGALLGLRVMAEIGPISVFALNIVTGLGLGLAVDYSLLIISRYREELARYGPGRETVHRTLSTAGRTVLHSSLLVTAALASLLVFPLAFLRSMAVGAMFVAVFSAFAALVVLPAMLTLLGERVNALSPRRWRSSAVEESRGAEGRWYRLARAVMRRPGAVAAVASAILVLLALPALDVRYTSVQPSSLPPTSSARQVGEALDRDFARGEAAPVFLAVCAPGGEKAAETRLGTYAARLAELPGASAVAPPRRVGEDLYRIDVLPSAAPFAGETRELVRTIRDTEAPYEVAVGGRTAEFLDQQRSLAEGLPLALAVVFTVTFALLLIATGSFVLPVKAFVLNLVTVAATIGVLAWIFQAGRFEDILNYRSQGAIENTQPVVIAVLAFGLSCDYGVFLLSRIREAHEAGLDDREAVAVGLARTGRIVTAAALLFCVALGSFATSGLVFVKQLGLGAALAVMIDATIVRALLVPSVMMLLGSLNWWAPAILKRGREPQAPRTDEKPAPAAGVLGTQVLEELRLMRLAYEETNRRLDTLESENRALREALRGFGALSTVERTEDGRDEEHS